MDEWSKVLDRARAVLWVVSSALEEYRTLCYRVRTGKERVNMYETSDPVVKRHRDMGGYLRSSAKDGMQLNVRPLLIPECKALTRSPRRSQL